MSKYIGEIFIYGGSQPPDKCVEAHGQALSRTIYADLFAVYGTLYGAGNGTTTFNVPDIRGRVVACSGDEESRLPFDEIGATGGSATHILSASQIPSLTTIGGDITAGQASFGNGEYEGESSPHNNVQPTIIIPFVIYTGVS